MTASGRRHTHIFSPEDSVQTLVSPKGGTFVHVGIIREGNKLTKILLLTQNWDFITVVSIVRNARHFAWFAVLNSWPNRTLYQTLKPCAA